MKTSRGRHPAISLCAGLTVAALFPALAAEPAQSAPKVPSAQEVVELSPFTVTTDRDVGYLAENTLAGSRLNTSLRDTAGSVTVFTKEFLDDLAITDVKELLEYSVNGEVNTNANQTGSNLNPVINAQSLTPTILVRGLDAGLGMDYFTSITPIDPYRAGRFEDTRGPNSILFGIGAPGGMLNQSSKVASTRGDSTNLRFSFGSWDRGRREMDTNRVLQRDRLAVSLAAVQQENGGWRAFDYQDKKRIFGSVTFRPIRTVTISAMGETGRDKGAVVRATVETDEALAWLDNRDAFGVSAVTFTPNNTLPTAAMTALGVVGRDGQRTGNNRRATFIENNGSIFDNIGAFISGSYNNSGVRAPDGTPGVTSSQLRVNDPRIYPRDINAAGPGMYREQSLKNYTITVDWQATSNLAFNLAHNYQDTAAQVNLMTGNDPTLRGDANRTLGVNGVANPYAGRLYYDGNWRRDVHVGDVRETRLSASYLLDTKSKWFGRHRIAGMYSESSQFDQRANSWLALAGRPFNNTPNNANNRITVRNYIDEGSWSTYRVGDWRSLPSTVNFGSKDYELAWANEVWGPNNSGGEQELKSMLGVVQSYFLAGKVVTTFGYRQDDVTEYELGFLDDPIVGNVLDRDRSKANVTSATGYTGTAGVVYHATKWLSLIANRSTNQGVPSFVRKVFPDGNLGASAKGHGEDYGIGLDLLDGRVAAKIVYFTSNEQGKITTNGFGGASGRNTRVMDAFASALVGPGLPYTQAQFDPIYAALTPGANASSSEYDSKGWEARVTTNLTRNWRLVANYSYTDSGRKNSAAEIHAWYGLTEVGGKLAQGVTQNASGLYTVNPSAYTPDGTVAKWIELAAKAPGANLGVLTTSNGSSVAQEIFNLVDTYQGLREDQDKRWGLRPHKISLFTAYDFKEGTWKGFTIGGGWRWRSTNVIGSDSQGNEITGKPITATDMMMAYSRKFEHVPGRFRFQINISNVLDKTDIIPVRLATSATAPDGWIVPGGRGVAYSRYDLVAPREIRCTTTWSF